MNKRKIATAMLLAAMMTAGGALRAQQAITIAGGDVTGSSGSLSFSCGEVAAQYAEQKAFTVVNITESFTEGVQQSFTERDKAANGISPLTVKLEVYPNPATDCVNIESDGLEPLRYTLYSANGQQLTQGECNGQERVEMSAYASGNYLLRIASNDNSEMNVYKIILVR